MAKRFYYKTQDEKGFLCLKHKLHPYVISKKGYIEITEEEFDELTNPEPAEEGE